MNRRLVLVPQFFDDAGLIRKAPRSHLRRLAKNDTKPTRTLFASRNASL